MTAPFDFNDSPNFKQVMRDYLLALRQKLFNHSFHPGSAPPIFPSTTISRRFRPAALLSQIHLNPNFPPLERPFCPPYSSGNLFERETQIRLARSSSLARSRLTTRSTRRALPAQAKGKSEEHGPRTPLLFASA